MKTAPHRFVLVAVTQTDAAIWADGIGVGSVPMRLQAPDPHREHHHVREAQHHGGHSRDANEETYFEAIAQSIAAGGEILLFGHGRGKASAMEGLIGHLKTRHPQLARRVAGTVTVDFSAMSEAEILAAARRWFDSHDRP